MPRVAAILQQEDGGADDLVASLALALMNQGWRVRGLAQERFRRDGLCQYTLIDLESGLAHSISQNLGRHSASCALNLQAMAEASLVLKRIARDGADLAVVNRFGKLEAEGQGFAAEMLEIMSRGIPLLTIVPEKYLADWRRFTGGMASELSGRFEVVMAWVQTHAGPRHRRPLAELAAEAGKLVVMPRPGPSKETLREGALAGVRRTHGVLQQQLARQMDVSQAQIANIEQKSDMLLSTLRRYVNSLGGELDLVARFPGVSYHLGTDGEAVQRSCPAVQLPKRSR